MSKIIFNVRKWLSVLCPYLFKSAYQRARLLSPNRNKMLSGVSLMAILTNGQKPNGDKLND